MRNTIRVVALLISLFVVSCWQNKSLRQALALAGDNRGELGKVLDHYRNDSLKLKAAEFLIANMVGHYSVDSTLLDHYEPFYKNFVSLTKGISHREFVATKGKEVDRLWNEFSASNYYNENRSLRSDLSSITSAYLISEIDLAFQAWQANVFTRDDSFEDFCEYILPYRRGEGLLLDDARKQYYRQHSRELFRDPNSRLLNDVDSLLFARHAIGFSYFYKAPIPIYNAETLERLRYGVCSDRCWYNSLLLSAMGVPAAIDFVPIWGNRNNPHSWNVVIHNGEIHPFDAFWNKDQWKYKRIYNNKTSDAEFGKFRIGKVYRQMYSCHWESTLLHEDMPKEDIPLLFRNYYKKDVTAEYVDAVDVDVKLTERVPDGAHYAYLCVYSRQQWHPINFGKIKENNRVVFQEMGKDVVYLPAYYKNGVIIPAGVPFLLKQDGSKQELSASKYKETIAVRNVTGSYLVRPNGRYMACMRGSVFVIGKNIEKRDTLCVLTDTLPLSSTLLSCRKRSSTRYIRCFLPSDSIALGDIAFYESGKRINGIKTVSTLISSKKDEEKERLVDGLDASVFRGFTKERYVDFDLGKEYSVDGIRITPYLKSEMKIGKEYELYSWDGVWRLLDRKQGNGDFITFENVPRNALLFLKECHSQGQSYERIFIHTDGEVDWR